MKWYRDTSIKTKLILSIAIACMGVLLSCLAFAWNDLRTMKEHLVRQTSTLADTLGANSVTAFLFDDPDVASEVLSSLRLEPSIDLACTYDRKGCVFATYGKGADLLAPMTLPIAQEGMVRNSPEGLEIIKPIQHNHEQIGAILLRIRTSELNQQFWQYAVVFTVILVFALAVTSGNAWLMHRAVSRPVLRLATAMSNVSETGNYTHQVTKEANDELGQLCDGFNAMLSETSRREQQIETLHEQLVDAARQAGQAEIAVSVLHNVGNVLNSVNVSTSLLMERLKTNRAEDLVRACALIDEHRDSVAEFFMRDPRGQKLPGFLNRLGETMMRENNDVLGELAGLEENVEHIKQVINMQQAFATTSNLQEPVDLAKLVDDAVKINDSSLMRHEIAVNRDYDDVPQVVTDKHKVMQILVNLIKNAKQAVSAAEREERWIHLRIHQDREIVLVQVSDNGVGISPENMSKLFTHGFTTKENGHGFGLHSGALAAKELGGKLTACSGGEGQGATFTLTLPLRTATAAGGTMAESEKAVELVT